LYGDGSTWKLHFLGADVSGRARVRKKTFCIFLFATTAVLDKRRYITKRLQLYTAYVCNNSPVLCNVYIIILNSSKKFMTSSSCRIISLRMTFVHRPLCAKFILRTSYNMYSAENTLYLHRYYMKTHTFNIVRVWVIMHTIYIIILVTIILCTYTYIILCRLLNIFYGYTRFDRYFLHDHRQLFLIGSMKYVYYRIIVVHGK